MGEVNRQWRLIRRPQGLLRLEDVEYREENLDTALLEPGQVRVRNHVFLCAPTMRNWMDEKSNALYPSIPLGNAIMAPAGAEVVDSAAPHIPVGTRISLISSWQDYEVIDTSHRPVQPLPAGLGMIDAIGKFGLNSLTAYFGLLKVGQPHAGETLLVSGAAGSTGSIVAQIGKILGCRVVGLAGGPEKCHLLKQSFGLDGAVDYQAGNIVDAIRSEAPDGVDIFFDNVGGEILKAAVETMNRFGRIVLCGQIAGYNDNRSMTGLTNMMRLIYGSIRMQGFLMGDYRDEVSTALTDLRDWEAGGMLKMRTDPRFGFENLPSTFNSLFDGSNNGTLLGVIR